jgi:GNAT superfamily N-acetyltransferase
VAGASAGGFVLRDGRHVVISPLTADDEAEVAALLAGASDERRAFYEQAANERADRRAGAFIAREQGDAAPVGYAAYAPSGELAGVVDQSYSEVGLGTLLMRIAAEDAQRAGLESLWVELHPGSEATAAMLRDLGMPIHWDLLYPVAKVTLALGGPRSDRATPDAVPRQPD